MKHKFAAAIFIIALATIAGRAADDDVEQFAAIRVKSFDSLSQACGNAGMILNQPVLGMGAAMGLAQLRQIFGANSARPFALAFGLRGNFPAPEKIGDDYASAVAAHFLTNSVFAAAFPVSEKNAKLFFKKYALEKDGGEDWADPVPVALSDGGLRAMHKNGHIVIADSSAGFGAFADMLLQSAAPPSSGAQVEIIFREPMSAAVEKYFCAEPKGSVSEYAANSRGWAGYVCAQIKSASIALSIGAESGVALDCAVEFDDGALVSRMSAQTPLDSAELAFIPDSAKSFLAISGGEIGYVDADSKGRVAFAGRMEVADIDAFKNNSVRTSEFAAEAYSKLIGDGEWISEDHGSMTCAFDLEAIADDIYKKFGKASDEENKAFALAAIESVAGKRFVQRVELADGFAIVKNAAEGSDYDFAKTGAAAQNLLAAFSEARGGVEPRILCGAALSSFFAALYARVPDKGKFDGMPDAFEFADGAPAFSVAAAWMDGDSFRASLNIPAAEISSIAAFAAEISAAARAAIRKQIESELETFIEESREKNVVAENGGVETEASDAVDAVKMTINISKDGETSIGQEPLTIQELREKCAALAADSTKFKIEINADKMAPHSAIVKVLDACNESASGAKISFGLADEDL